MVNLARGLSLIELLIALVIAAILITIGVPSLNSLLDRFRAENAASQWQTDLVYARQIAVANAFRHSTAQRGTWQWGIWGYR